METLRILWLNWRDITSPLAGGAELYTHQVAARLARDGHELTLFTSRYFGCREREERNGVDVVRKGSSLTVYLQAPIFVRAQRRRGTRYDVIIDAINTIPFLSRLYAGDATVIALIYQLTGEIFRKEFTAPVGFLFSGLEKHSYIPWYLKRVDRVVTISSSTKSEILEICPHLNQEKVAVLTPGVDHDKFEPGKKSNEPLLLFMNRLVRYKQPEHVIMAMKEVCTRVPNAKLLVVGTHAGGRMITQLKNLVNHLGLNGKVSFLLSKPFGSRKIGLMQSAWVHVLPSMKEGFGLSILETAACGTPTVGYDVPGVRDAVVQGKTGLLVPSGDVLSFARSLTSLLTDSNELRELSDRATKWAANFHWDDTARRFEEIMQTT